MRLQLQERVNELQEVRAALPRLVPPSPARCPQAVRLTPGFSRP